MDMCAWSLLAQGQAWLDQVARRPLSVKSSNMYLLHDKLTNKTAVSHTLAIPQMQYGPIVIAFISGNGSNITAKNKMK